MYKQIFENFVFIAVLSFTISQFLIFLFILYWYVQHTLYYQLQGYIILAGNIVFIQTRYNGQYLEQFMHRQWLQKMTQQKYPPGEHRSFFQSLPHFVFMLISKLKYMYIYKLFSNVQTIIYMQKNIKKKVNMHPVLMLKWFTILQWVLQCNIIEGETIIQITYAFNYIIICQLYNCLFIFCSVVYLFLNLEGLIFNNCLKKQINKLLFRSVLCCSCNVLQFNGAYFKTKFYKYYSKSIKYKQFERGVFILYVYIINIKIINIPLNRQQLRIYLQIYIDIYRERLNFYCKEYERLFCCLSINKNIENRKYCFTYLFFMFQDILKNQNIGGTFT
eukprot:TRINITY_DN5845_c0_g1_i13.p1 TRINITY_DN5845_c0_g1~~TRINITY_DN5845_c0_g1_i13.p1  ORF type:complete len:332 (+),score=-39.21 TRINITY_DN5845_c0_g1_i13:422-1417(+)